MDMNLDYFAENDFFPSLQKFFKDLEVPIQSPSSAPLELADVLQERYKPDDPGHQLAQEVFFVGMVDERAFAGANSNTSLRSVQVQKRAYPGLLVFGVSMERENRLPTRGQMISIVRDINRSFSATPVVVVFKYGHFLSFAAIERQAYKQAWREGEKTGKVFILRDVDFRKGKTHRGHLQILEGLQVPRTGKDAVESYEALYAHWHKVLNVSILNKKFYKELQAWFFWAIDRVDFPDTAVSVDKRLNKAQQRQQRNAISVIRMLTRIIFVWFLKERKLVPDALFDQGEVMQLLEAKDKTGSTYYKAILQNLFFATLNTRMDKDSKYKRTWVSRQTGVQGFFRYKRFFKAPDQALRMFGDVPFLNGGLFENLDRKQGEDRILVDCFSNRTEIEKLLSVPDDLFFQKETLQVDLTEHLEEKPGKTRRLEDVRGLFTILNDYKFTIAENTPVDQEVALDPELLGKVFENLLAAYNPETKSTARNATGSFYTPREIVDYMVDESLIAYLKKELLSPGYFKAFGEEQIALWGNEVRHEQLVLHESPEELWEEGRLEAKLRELFSFEGGQPFQQESERMLLIDCLNNCRIIDPACGSGAFPMGILQKMVLVLHKLDPDNQLWKEAQETKARRELKEDLDRIRQIQDEGIREAAEAVLEDKLRSIEQNFDPDANELDFARKLYLIENCIFGVDKQPIATQISKLRFFISLLVEQKVEEDAENRGIIPLPNLETKFVAADSLVSLRRPEQMALRNLKIETKEADLMQVRREYFKARTTKTKANKREKDKLLREEISALLVEDGWSDKTARLIAAWDPYNQNAHADFFDAEWMFGVQPPLLGGGFDVVIGNPPYVQVQSFSGKPEQKAWEAEKYETYTRTGDIYSLFYEQGHRILREGGILAYITSNKWMRTKYGEKTRKFFSEKTNPFLLIDFGMAQNFESATTYTNILLFEKGRNQRKTLACRIKGDFQQEDSLSAYFQKNHSVVGNYGVEGWVAYTAEEYAIKRRVEQQGYKLADTSRWRIVINYGIKTGLNEAFVINGEDRARLLAADPRNAELIKPILRGRDVQKWYPAFEDWWLINTHNGLRSEGIDPINAKKDYPQIYEWLSGFGDKIRKRTDKGAHWSNLRNCAYWRDFEKPKIIYPNMTKYLPFAYDHGDHFYLNDKGFIVTGDHLKYLTAVFNSSLYYFCFVDHFPELLGNTREVRKVFFEQIPIKVPSPAEEAPLERMTEYLSYLRRNEDKAKDALLMALFFEQVADGLVFELYLGEEFRSYGKGLREHLQDLPPVADFKDMKYFEAIRRVYRELSAPEHILAYNLQSLRQIPEVDLVLHTNKESGHV